MPLNDERPSTCYSFGGYDGSHWGRDTPPEAAQQAVTFGFLQLRLPELVAFTVIANLKSLAVIERLGMRLDSEFDHPHVAGDSGLGRHTLHRLRAREYNYSRHPYCRLHDNEFQSGTGVAFHTRIGEHSLQPYMNTRNNHIFTADRREGRTKEEPSCPIPPPTNSTCRNEGVRPM